MAADDLDPEIPADQARITTILLNFFSPLTPWCTPFFFAPILTYLFPKTQIINGFLLNDPEAERMGLVI